jgi:hypothetical protein
MYRVVGFDNKQHKFNFSKNKHRSGHKNKSSLHLEARQIIKELYPSYSLYEEVTLPGSKKLGRQSLLYADFFIPDLMLIVEVHGQQHYSYSSFFHKDAMDFLKSKQRDKDKIEWCDLNDIQIVILPYNERKEWKNLIVNRNIQ